MRALLTAVAFAVFAPSGHAAALTGIAKVTAGYRTCAVADVSGAVSCWGGTGLHALGDGGVNTWRSSPVDVAGAQSGIRDVVTPRDFTCALTVGGAVKCWGGLNFPATPRVMDALSSGVQALTGGENHICALTTSGGVKCAGDLSGAGDLGYDWPAPDVPGLQSGVVQISAGARFTCALTSGGAVKCWGNNFEYGLGDGSKAASSTPVDVVGLQGGVVSIEAGSFSACAVMSAGTVKCWGFNKYGELGDGTTLDSPIPVDVQGLSGVVAVSAGWTHACALMAGGAVQCWGSNSMGEIGDGTRVDRHTPVAVAGLSSGVLQVSAGIQYNCAVQAGGVVKCWGGNGSGQIGDGANLATTSFPPSDVRNLEGVVVDSLSVAASRSCAVTHAGGAKCWGYDQYYGLLGDGDFADKDMAVDVLGNTSGVQSISVGQGHTCLLTTAGGVRCWTSTPTDVPTLTSGVVQVAAGNGFTCALLVGGSVKCWGQNASGNLGNGTTTDSSTPVDVIGLGAPVVAISASHTSHVCAITTAGAVKCWGSNSTGALGVGASGGFSSTAVDAAGLQSGVVGIAAGWGFTCALTSTGGVKCWGQNASGELGDGTTNTRFVPGDVPTLTSGVRSVSAGPSYACAVLDSGVVKCWGDNSRGQALGDNTLSTNRVPTQVPGIAGAALVAVGGSVTSQPGYSFSPGYYAFEAHTCVALMAGGVKCWGDNATGQIGDGGRAPRLTPVSPVVQTDAELRIASYVAPATAATDKDLVYDITLANDGPRSATSITLTHSLPPTSSFIWGSPGCSAGSTNIVCNVGSLSTGQTLGVRIVVRPGAAGAVSATVSVAAAEPDPNAANNTASSSVSVTASTAGAPVLRYRLYSPITKEHHFTTDQNEYNVLPSFGWVQEGNVGKVLNNPGAFNGVTAVPYYRLYNFPTRWHHWTTDANEYYTLLTFPGWGGEGVDGYLLPSATTGTTQLYRLTYPFIGGLHHWTIDRNEYDTLISTYGWVGEGGSGFVIQ